MKRRLQGQDHTGAWDGTQAFLSRTELATRWGVSKETIKRREREGLLTPIRFNQRLLRYRLEDVIEIERTLLA